MSGDRTRIVRKRRIRKTKKPLKKQLDFPVCFVAVPFCIISIITLFLNAAKKSVRVDA